MNADNSSTTSQAAGRSTTAAVRHSRRWLPYLGGLVLLGMLVLGLWPQPVRVEIARATAGRLRATLNEEGKTRIRERFVVAAPVAGQLRRIALKAGDRVEASRTVLAVLDPLAPTPLDARSRTLAEAGRDTAAAGVEKARAARTFASSELRRFQQLHGAGSVSIQELEAAQLREAAAARDQAAAESQLRQAEAELAEFPGTAGTGTDPARTPMELKAPADGQVLRVFEESSRVVAMGTPLLEIGNAADLEVVVEVLSRDGAAIPAGAAVELAQWGGGPPLEGKVRLVEPAAFTKVSALGVEEQRVRVVIDVLTPPERRSGLGDQYRVEAHIVLWEADRVLQVPSGALFRQGNDWAAYVVNGGRARVRKVGTGRASGSATQVLEGLQEGEAVILYPGDRVREGERVRPIRISD